MVYDVLELRRMGVFFDKGKEKTTAFRADMDALPVEEAAGRMTMFLSTKEGCMPADMTVICPYF